MPQSAQQTIDDLHRAVLQRDAALLKSLMAEDVVFRPPTYWSEWRGSDVVSRLLVHVSHVFEDFTYHRTWIDGADAALEFTARIGQLDAKGVDLISLDEAGRIVLFEVVMRPARSIAELRDAMNQRVKSDPAFAGKG